MRILASEQVQDWLVALPPETKRRVRKALRQLQSSRGDIRGLRGSLQGFNRVRIGGMRIVDSQKSGNVIQLEYAESRDVVYENFLRVLERRKRG